MQSKIQDILESYGEDLMLMDGYDDCILGVGERFNSDPHVVYDLNRVIGKLIDSGMSEEEAHEYFEYNMLGAYVGDHTPSFIRLF